MNQEAKISAILETGETALSIEKDTLTQQEAEKIGHRPQNYREFTEKALDNQIFDVPNYHTVAERLLKNPTLLYENDLVEDEIKDEIDRHLDVLRENRKRDLNNSEIEAVISTAFKDRNRPKATLDKQEIVDSLYINVYRDPEPETGHIDYDQNTA